MCSTISLTLLGVVAALAPSVAASPPAPGAALATESRQDQARGHGPAAGRGAVQLARRTTGERVPGADRVADPVAVHDLARARAAFVAADRDGDGLLQLPEARRAGLLRREHLDFDTDGDGRIAIDEFLVGYRALVGAAGRAVEPDLLAEATRIEARRRVLAAVEGLGSGDLRSGDRRTQAPPRPDPSQPQRRPDPR